MNCKVECKKVSTKKLTSPWTTHYIKTLINEKHGNNNNDNLFFLYKVHRILFLKLQTHSIFSNTIVLGALQNLHN